MSDNKDLALLAEAAAQLPANARQLKHADEAIGIGIAAPFAVIGYKGARWSIRHRGNVTMLEKTDQDGEKYAVPHLDLIALYAATHNSKTYYEKAWVDGNDDPPDCWSTDGTKPDNAAKNKQNPTCSDCRHNEFGSRINQVTQAKGKACGDFRRWAVVPYGNIENEALGGPMLLRIPPASLAAVGEFSDKLKANSVPYAAVAIRVGFATGESYPKMTFRPVAILTYDEVERVRRMQDHPLVDRIVQEQMENMPAQLGSEQGQNVTPPSSRSQTNGSVKAPPPKSDDPFSQVRTDGPSYAGRPQQPVGAQAVSPEAQAQDLSKTAPAAKSEALTPEQARIRELEAKLAAAEAKPTRAPRRRTQPVAPQAEAQPHVAASNGEEDGSGTEETVTQGNDPALKSISDRLEKLL